MKPLGSFFRRSKRPSKLPLLWITFFTVAFTYAVIVSLLRLANIYPLYSGDFELYEKTGLEYLQGVAPLVQNPEHPPLAKYIIGACVATGFRGACPLLATIVGGLALSYTAYLVSRSERAAAVYALAFIFEPVTVSMGMLNLLDPYMLMFTGLAIAVTVKAELVSSRRLLVAAGVLWGAALAAKMPSLYLLAAIVAWYMLVKRDWESVLVLTTVPLVVFLATFAVDVARYGPAGLLLHFKRMYNIMEARHGFELFLAIDGLIYFILQIEVWRYVGSVALTFINGTLANVTYHFLEKPRAEITFIPYMHNYLHIYAIGLVPSLLRGKDYLGKLVGLLALFSLTMLLYGPIWWYLVLPSAMLHLVLVYVHRGEGRLSLLHLLGTFVLWALYFAIGAHVKMF